jgi:hypothetical protein
VDAELVWRESGAAENANRLIDDASLGSAPARVNYRHCARWMRQKYRRAIGNRHSKGQPSLLGRMAVGWWCSQKTGPWIDVRQHNISVNLWSDANTSHADIGKQVTPPCHHLANRIGSSESECAGRARGRESYDVQIFEFGYVLSGSLHYYFPRPSPPTRVMCAPSALSRSSMRS